MLERTVDVKDKIKYDARGGYFMSQEQQDEVIGRVVRQHREAQQRMVLLEAEAKKYSQMFSDMAATLASSPQSMRVVKPDESYTPVGPRAFLIPDADTLNKLAKDIRDTKSNLQELERQKQVYGV